MVATTYQGLFHHTVINRVVSQIRGPSNRLVNYYGLYPGGPNVQNLGGFNIGWDIFNRTRRIPKFRHRAAGPATSKRQVIGHVTATTNRLFEQIPIPYDMIYRTRGIGQPLGSVDIMGERYITKQMAYQAERFLNVREAMLAFMFQGGFDLIRDGDDMTLVPQGTGQLTVDFKHPTSNSDPQLDGGSIFAANWHDTANAKPLTEIRNLNAHAAKNSRYVMNKCWITTKTANALLENAQAIAQGGTANVVTGDPRNQSRGTIDMAGVSNAQGQLANGMSFVLKGHPQLEFETYDDEIELDNGTRISLLDDDYAIFTPAPSAEWLEWINGSEVHQKRLGGPREEVYGMDFWMDTVRHPVQEVLYGYDNGICAPYVPQAWYRVRVATHP